MGISDSGRLLSGLRSIVYLIVSAINCSILIGSPSAYLSRDRCAIMWASNSGTLQLDTCNWQLFFNVSFNVCNLCGTH